MKYILLFCISIFGAFNLAAHGDLDKRINEKTKAIKAQPDNALLYYERGYLYQQHEDYELALTDYLQAEQLNFKEEVLYFRLAETELLSLNFSKSAAYTERCLSINSLNVKTHRLRGKLFNVSKQYDKAITAYQFVLDHAIDLHVENYIELSETYLQKDTALVDSALLVIDKGIHDLGQEVYVFKKYQLDYLLLQKDSEKIIACYDDLITFTHRKENIYYQKSTYLYSIRQYHQAYQTLEMAKMAYSRLHPRLKRTKAITQLLKEISVLEKQILEAL